MIDYIEQLSETLGFHEETVLKNQTALFYTYNGFELDTYFNADIDYISAIIFKNDYYNNRGNRHRGYDRKIGADI